MGPVSNPLPISINSFTTSFDMKISKPLTSVPPFQLLAKLNGWIKIGIPSPLLVLDYHLDQRMDGTLVVSPLAMTIVGIIRNNKNG